jgi:hypothetical protein
LYWTFHPLDGAKGLANFGVGLVNAATGLVNGADPFGSPIPMIPTFSACDSPLGASTFLGGQSLAILTLPAGGEGEASALTEDLAAGSAGILGATSRAEARATLGNLNVTEAQAAAANRAIGRATSSSTIDVTTSGPNVVVRIIRPGTNGHQVIESIVGVDGSKSVVQLAYDSQGNLVHYDPKTP